MDKKRVAVDYEKASPEVLKAIKEKYPNGVEGNLIRFTKADQTYYAISVETENAIYLVKIKKNTPTVGDDDDDDDDYGDDSADTGTDIADDDDDDDTSKSSEDDY